MAESAQLEIPKASPPHLSFSRLSTYAGCPARYKLRYLDRVTRRPNGAGIGGKVVHEVIVEAEAEVAWADEDAWEQDGVWAQRFRELFDEELDKAGGPDACHWGGRTSKAWPNGEDPDWWRHKGAVFLYRFAALRRLDEERGLVIPDGGIEMEVGVPVEVACSHCNGTGSIRLGVDEDGPCDTCAGSGLRQALVKGYLDAIPFVDQATGLAEIRDYKTGTWLDPLQLVTYAWMVQTARGWTVESGHFAKLRAEDPEDVVHSYDLRPWLEADIAPERYTALAIQIQQSTELDLWPVNPSNLCVACDVKDSCPWGRTVEKRT